MIVWAFILAIFAALRPLILKEIVDDFLIKSSSKTDFLFVVSIMGIVLLIEVISQFFFTYWANWLGQDIIKDIRLKLYQHIA